MAGEVVPSEVVRSISRLLRECPSCGGYAAKPPIVLPTYKGTEDRCDVCAPLRNWMWERHGVEFECLT